MEFFNLDGREKAPILKMLGSIPVLALILTTFGFGWGYFTLLNQTPIYLHSVLNVCLTTVTIKQDALYN